MMKVKTTAGVAIAGEHVEPGTELELEDGLAQGLIASERAVAVDEPKAAEPAADVQANG